MLCADRKDMFYCTIHIVFVFFRLFSSFYQIESTCTYPDDLTVDSWHDSQLGLLTFNSSHFTTASAIGDFGTQTFECYETSNGIYYSVSQTFKFLSSTFRLGLCWALSQKSSTKFIYYQLVPILQNTTNLRVVFKLSSSSFSLETDCASYTSPYDAYLIRALIRNGTIASGTSQCPDVLLGIYLYSYNTGSGNLCTSGSELDVCNNTHLMTFNYTACSEIQGYSREGNLNCVYSDVYDSTWYTLAYNLDLVEPDDSTYYRYTCYAAYQESNGTVFVTQHPGTCFGVQSAFSVDSPGAALVLYPNITCVPVAPTTAAPSTDLFSASTLIAVAVLVFLVIVASSIVGCIWCYKKWKAKKVSPLKSGKIPFDRFDRGGSAASRSNVNITPYSPYPTLSEIATFRFGPSPIPDDDGGLTLGTHTPGITDGEAITLAPTTPGPYGYYYYDDYEEEDEDEEEEDEEDEEEEEGEEDDLKELKILEEGSGDDSGVEQEVGKEAIINQVVKKQSDGDDVSLPVYTDYGADTPEPTRLKDIAEDIDEEDHTVDNKEPRPPSEHTVQSVSHFDEGFSVRP